MVGIATAAERSLLLAHLALALALLCQQQLLVVYRCLQLSLAPAKPKPSRTPAETRHSPCLGHGRLIPAVEPLLPAYLGEYLVFQGPGAVITELSLREIKAD